MEEWTLRFKKEGCKNCGSFKEKDKLMQKENWTKIIEKIPFCKLFKQELKNTIACDKFELNFKIIRDKMFEGVKEKD